MAVLRQNPAYRPARMQRMEWAERLKEPKSVPKKGEIVVRTCAIVASMPFDNDVLSSLVSAGSIDFIIAADAGFSHLKKLGIKADLVVGDFDSLGYVPEGPDVVLHPAHKDESDLELALEEAAARKFDAAIVCGALGGRLDHTIAALHACARFAEAGMDIALIGEDAVVKILVGPGTYDLPEIKEGTVSVFSAVDESQGVNEYGMEYPLEDAALGNRTSLGLSNELIGQSASVSVEKGTLYIIHPVR